MEKIAIVRSGEMASSYSLLYWTENKTEVVDFYDDVKVLEKCGKYKVIGTTIKLILNFKIKNLKSF
jgi:hypothetical protein